MSYSVVFANNCRAALLNTIALPGEIFSTKDLKETREILESHSIRFHYPAETENEFFSNKHFNFTFPSAMTGNRIGYTPHDAFSLEEPEHGK